MEIYNIRHAVGIKASPEAEFHPIPLYLLFY